MIPTSRATHDHMYGALIAASEIIGASEQSIVYLVKIFGVKMLCGFGH